LPGRAGKGDPDGYADQDGEEREAAEYEGVAGEYLPAVPVEFGEPGTVAVCRDPVRGGARDRDHTQAVVAQYV
jgi:hypothetical protein